MAKSRSRRKKELSPAALVVILALVIIGAIGNAAQSCSSSATPSPDPAVETTEPTSPAPIPAPTSTPAPARNDVALLNCAWKTDTYNIMTTATVNVRIVNHTDSAEFYSVDVGLSDAQGQSVATAYAIAESVPPGGTVTVTGTGYPSGPVPGMRCQVTDVLRIPASTGGGVAGGGVPDLGLPHGDLPDLDPFHIHLGHGHGHR